MCSPLLHYALSVYVVCVLRPRVLISDNEHLYDFGVWDIHGVSYDRWSINFFAAWGHEIIAARPFPEDDEQHLSADYPQSIRKRTPCIPTRVPTRVPIPLHPYPPASVSPVL